LRASGSEVAGVGAVGAAGGQESPENGISAAPGD
jgi:hypothetical protein